MEIFARQGDLVINRIDKADGELMAVTNHVFAGDSSGHPHILKGKAKIRMDGRRTVVQLAKATEMTHGKADGHKTIALPAGAYEVMPLRERGDEGDRAVED